MKIDYTMTIEAAERELQEWLDGIIELSNREPVGFESTDIIRRKLSALTLAISVLQKYEAIKLITSSEDAE